MVFSTESFPECKSLTRINYVRMVNCNVENKSNLVYEIENFKTLRFALQNISTHFFCMQMDGIYFSVF